ncbi:MAG: hypothetical protein GY862_22170 [Gammaproteobacteria bacterium]|nr:hypothetical protein [Gammaproteobacteria bacterium]
MKIWYGYGSEHSMNLVMIGQFKNAGDAKKAKEAIDLLMQKLPGKIDIDSSRDRYGEDVSKLLEKINGCSISPVELEQFLYDTHTQLQGDKIILTTEESDVSAFLKLMIDKGAKVETFSAHDYPDAEYGRGK